MVAIAPDTNTPAIIARGSAANPTSAIFQLQRGGSTNSVLDAGELGDGGYLTIQRSGGGSTNSYITMSAQSQASLLTLNRAAVGNDQYMRFFTGGSQKWLIGHLGTDFSESLFFRDSNSNNVMTLAQGGNVGIGTSSPTNKLEVQGSTFFGGALFGTSTLTLTGTTGTSTIASGQGFTIGGSQFVLQQGSGNVGIGTASPVSPLHVTGDIRSNTGFVISSTGSLNNGVYGGGLNLGTGGAVAVSLSTNAAERIRIDTSGKVGIGTTTPWGKLSITGSGTGTGLAFAVADSANTPRFVIQDNGNVGIGTTTPTNKLEVAGNTFFGGTITGTSTLALTGTTGTSTIAAGQGFTIGGSQFVVQQGSGNVGIGTASPASPLHVTGDIRSSTGFVVSGLGYLSNGIYGGGLNIGTGGAAAVSLSTNAAERIRIDTSGNVGIGTTSPTAQLHTTGTVRFSNFRAGTLTTDASGNLSVSSDERLKNIDGQFTRSLDDVIKLSPISYHWNAISGLDTTMQYSGFSAQDVQKAIPEAVSTSSSGYLSLQDRPILAAVVNAIKEIANITGLFRSNLVAWLGDAGNGVTDLFAHRGHFDELCVENGAADPNPVCVTKSQLAAILVGSGQSANSSAPGVPSSTSTPTSSSTPQAPVIELNGNATSTINVGDTYADLGARIIAPTSDLNLGLVILLDGATTTAVSIDTSQPGEHTILYTVTSPATGLTGSIMRTVIIAPAKQSAEPPANDNPFNAPEPANDNASSTHVLIAS